MPAILGWLFSGLVDVFLYFFNLFSKNWTIPIVRAYQVAFFLAFIAFIGAFFRFAYSVYSFLSNGINTLNNAIVNPNGELLSVAFAVLKTIGFFEALASTFNVFAPLLFGVFLIYTLKALSKIAFIKYDSVFKTALLYSSNSKSKNGKRFFKK